MVEAGTDKSAVSTATAPSYRQFVRTASNEASTQRCHHPSMHNAQGERKLMLTGPPPKFSSDL